MMRCLAIAEEMKERGWGFCFFGPIELPAWVSKKLELITGQEVSNFGLDNFRPNPNTDCLILDSYLRDPAETILDLEKWKHVTVIADSVTPNFQAHLTISPNLEKLSGFTNLRYGTSFIPIRNELLMKDSPNSADDRQLRVLIVGGGTDPTGFTKLIVKEVEKLTGNYCFDVICSDADLISEDSRIVFHYNRDEYRELLVKCDIGIIPASTTSFEFIANHKPIAISAVVENQSSNYEALLKAELAVGLGDNLSYTSGAINHVKLENFLSNPELRMRIVRNQKALNLGDGSKNIVDAIAESLMEES